MRALTHAATLARRTAIGALLAVAVAGTATPATAAAFVSTVAVASAQPASATAVAQWANQLWDAAERGDDTAFDRLLAEAPDNADRGLIEAIDVYRANIGQREAKRAELIAKAETELAEALAGERTADKLSEALVTALELAEVSRDRDSVLADPRVNELVRAADRAARQAETEGDWLIANELFYRLNELYLTEAIYLDDLDRQNRRLAQLQLYNPQRLWELRNQRRLMEDEAEPLPPYNPLADGFAEKLAGIDARAVRRALTDAAAGHVDQVAGVRELVVGGLDSLETMLATSDVRAVFEKTSSARAIDQLLAFVREEREKVRGEARVSSSQFYATINGILRTNRDLGEPVSVEALLHEFGNGATSELDQFSSIIWPDELRQFERQTQGNFVGVGIQIQLDEQRNIRIVSPIEGTPAFRAGVKAGDIIKFVNGQSTSGLGLNQAVDIITGPAKTTVTLGVERVVENDAGEEEKTLVEIPIVRDRISVPTVQGWRRLDANGRWDYMVDPDRGIGYVRLTQFTDSTTRDFDQAIEDMRRGGLNALILDLRFNPGGLLTQAVSISDRFVGGGLPIVSTEDRLGRTESIRNSTRRATLNDIPVVVLVNEGAASASEIVSGAIQDHAEDGALQAVLLGRRTFGKGSVQRVSMLPGGQSALKLTSEYYVLPKGRHIHRKPGATQWGVDPNLEIEMLPSQIADALVLRRDADALPDEAAREAPADPVELISGGSDLQLNAALVLLQARTTPKTIARTTRSD